MSSTSTSRLRRLALVTVGGLVASGLQLALSAGSPATAAPAATAAAAAAVATGVIDGYGVANDGATSVVDLAGTWNFAPVSPAAAATTIQVPGGGWYKQGFTATNEAIYSRSITVPASSTPQTVILSLGAVNNQATLKIGSTTVGTTTTSFTPTSFDLTPYVKAGQTYQISLDVKSRGALRQNNRYLVPEAAEWAESLPQGIYRSATLRTYPQTYVASSFVRTSVANKTVSYDVTLRNTTATAKTVTLAGSFTSANGSNFSYPTVANRSVTVPANGSTTTTIGPLAWTAGTASYWWPNVPYRQGYRAQLHVLKLDLSGTGIAQTTRTRFGFREFTQPPNQTQYFLNGVAVNLRGDDLQGADYDRIDNGGKGDAYDTLPGFLPASGSNGGWPQAVDNYQRLNYNVVRLHQEIPSPYMLDVLDEMGQMAIGESAIRGSAGVEDFVAGHDNMVNNVRDLVTRDRNHAAIVEWSQSNEPANSPTDSEQFEKDLFNAIRSLDPTRPIIVDGSFPSHYPSMTPANGYTQFNGVGHYLDGFNSYGTYVASSTTNPNGEGEYIWPGSSTKQGFTWFATSTAGKRGKGAADLRPYALLSGWAGFVPGVTSTSFNTEEGRRPLYGADNLPDPWSNPQIRLIQDAFNPYLAADLPYWDASGSSDSDGTFPVASRVTPLGFGKQVTRQITVFNDGLSGTALTLSWEQHSGSATGPVVSSGNTALTVPVGGRATTPVTFTTPSSGTGVYLTLATSAAGTTQFSDKREYFPLGTSSTPTPTSSSIDDAVIGTGNGQFTYTGAWGHATGENGTYLGTNSYSRITNDTATLTFTGTRATYYAAKGPNHGIVAVSVDGGAEQRVDLYATARAGNQSVYTTPTLSNGSHTLTIRVTGQKNASASDVYGTVDRVDVAVARSNTIVGVQSQRCLDLYGRNQAEGATVDIYDCGGGANQSWTLSPNGELVNADGNKCLDVAGGKAGTDGTGVVLNTCSGATSQKWSYDGSQRFVNATANKCLDVFNNATANQSKVVVYTCNAGANQRWQF